MSDKTGSIQMLDHEKLNDLLEQKGRTGTMDVRGFSCKFYRFIHLMVVVIINFRKKELNQVDYVLVLEDMIGDQLSPEESSNVLEQEKKVLWMNGYDIWNALFGAPENPEPFAELKYGAQVMLGILRENPFKNEYFEMNLR